MVGSLSVEGYKMAPKEGLRSVVHPTGIDVLFVFSVN